MSLDDLQQALPSPPGTQQPAKAPAARPAATASPAEASPANQRQRGSRGERQPQHGRPQHGKSTAPASERQQHHPPPPSARQPGQTSRLAVPDASGPLPQQRRRRPCAPRPRHLCRQATAVRRVRAQRRWRGSGPAGIRGRGRPAGSGRMLSSPPAAAVVELASEGRAAEMTSGGRAAVAAKHDCHCRCRRNSSKRRPRRGSAISEAAPEDGTLGHAAVRLERESKWARLAACEEKIKQSHRVRCVSCVSVVCLNAPVGCRQVCGQNTLKPRLGSVNGGKGPCLPRVQLELSTERLGSPAAQAG